jgi:hypothetical protein
MDRPSLFSWIDAAEYKEIVTVDADFLLTLGFSCAAVNCVRAGTL